MQGPRHPKAQVFPVVWMARTKDTEDYKYLSYVNVLGIGSKNVSYSSQLFFTHQLYHLVYMY